MALIANPQSRVPLAFLLVLFGAAASIMLAGTEDAWAIAVFLALAGAALVLLRPACRPGTVPLLVIPLFCLLALLAFLPQDYFPLPEWRGKLMRVASVPLAESVNPQPWLSWFWWWLLAATCVVYAALLTAPLDSRPLALFLHTAALFVAAYASLAMFSLQTGWKYPFHGGAVFGFLPNRNHTATLLVVGAVLSFGLMQWRVARGDKGGAVLAALCGAPSLAALLFFSTSRAGVLFLIVGLSLWAVGASKSAVMRARVWSAVWVLAIFLAVLFLAGGSTVRDRLAALWTDAVSVQMEDSGKDVDFRQPVFRDTVRLIADFPLTGTGLGQFRYVFPQYREDSARAANVLHPESDWLMTAAETGLPSALVLATLSVWYLVVCWRARSRSGGMLRWTAASAVAAAVLHGAIDVPWHRVSLGWFLLALAAASVPATGRQVSAPALARFVFVVCGMVLMAAAGFIAFDKTQGSSPVPYSWPEMSESLEQLGRDQRYDEAETAAQDAVRRFPLRYESHYWLAGHLRAFEETGAEVDAAIQAGQAVEPVLAKVAEEQAAILESVDTDKAMQAWGVAIDRALAIDHREGGESGGATAEMVRKALLACGDDTTRQLALARYCMAQPRLLGYWINHASGDAAASLLPQIQSIGIFADSLPAAQRRQVFSRWTATPDAARAVAFMEEREALSVRGEYWPILAKFYAAQGDLPRAVHRAASSRGVSLEAPKVGQQGLRGEIATVAAGGNPVAARRMAREALEDKEAVPDDLEGAMAYFASQGDWPSAWQAASRLASEAKLGH